MTNGSKTSETIYINMYKYQETFKKVVAFAIMPHHCLSQLASGNGVLLTEQSMLVAKQASALCIFSGLFHV